MNRPESRTSAIRSFSSSSSGAYCARTSTSGICGTTGQSSASVAEVEVGDPRDDQGGDGVVDEVPVLLEAVVVAAEPVAHARQREAPGDTAQEREDREAHRLHPEHAGRHGHERAHDGRHAAEEDGGIAEANEPALRPLELVRVEMQPAAVAFDERPPSV